MSLLQGNTYNLPIQIADPKGNLITSEMVQKAVFKIGNLTKEYGTNGDVQYDNERQCWVIPLSEQETFAFSKTIEWQARFLFTNGKVDGTLPQVKYVYDSIEKTILTEEF